LFQNLPLYSGKSLSPSSRHHLGKKQTHTFASNGGGKGALEEQGALEDDGAPALALACKAATAGALLVAGAASQTGPFSSSSTSSITSSCTERQYTCEVSNECIEPHL